MTIEQFVLQPDFVRVDEFWTNRWRGIGKHYIGVEHARFKTAIVGNIARTVIGEVLRKADFPGPCIEVGSGIIIDFGNSNRTDRLRISDYELTGLASVIP